MTGAVGMSQKSTLTASTLGLRGGKMARVLIACEESQAVCKAFRARGHEAYSCDLQPCSGGHPEWHIQGDALEALHAEDWNLLIAHPPCTYMSKAGARWMYPTAGSPSKERYRKAMEAKEFFMRFLDSDVPRIAVENPRPMKIVGLPEPSQTIQPYAFGDPYSKATHLWLRNLPPLMATLICSTHVPWVQSNTGAKARGGKSHPGIARSAKERSKTFPGIAQAMADQWGPLLEEES